ncbi:MAG: hypothetical protein QG573_616 [Acidobacteriota bacterium]|nr:hypothetical protein [Acidobacteriota bacterium]
MMDRRGAPALSSRRFAATALAASAAVLVLASPVCAQLAAAGAQFIFDSETGPWVGFAAVNDQLGHAMAAGDWNADGFADLAVADRDNAVLSGAGTVYVELSFGRDGAPFLHQKLNDFVPGDPVVADRQANDQFGDAFAVGDFDGDGVDDLAIGAPGQAVAGHAAAGSVLILRGFPGWGLVDLGAMRLVPGEGSLGGFSPAPNDRFGAALVAADFDLDGFDDLAVGVPGRGVSAPPVFLPAAGAVVVLFGAAGGMTGGPPLVFTQNSVEGDNEMQETAETADRFGSTLAAGDFDGNGVADLAIGVPAESLGASENGIVQVLPSTAGVGPRVFGNRLFVQGSNGVPGTAGDHNRFGFALAAGDFDGLGIDDLAIGAPDESVTAGSLRPSAGVLYALYGIADIGLTATAATRFTQSILIPGYADFPETGDRWSYSLSAADFNGDGRDDLAVGAPGESIVLPGGEVFGAGAIALVYGSSTGLQPFGPQMWFEGANGTPGLPQADDFYGAWIVAADIDGNHRADVAIGAVGQDIGPNADAGGVHMIYSAHLFVDGFELGNTDRWSATTP